MEPPTNLLDAHLAELAKHELCFDDLANHVKNLGIASHPPAPGLLRACYPTLDYKKDDISALTTRPAMKAYHRLTQALSGISLKKGKDVYLVRICRLKLPSERNLAPSYYLFMEKKGDAPFEPREDFLCTNHMELEVVPLAKILNRCYSLNASEQHQPRRHKPKRAKKEDDDFEPDEEEAEEVAPARGGLSWMKDLVEGFSLEYLVVLVLEFLGKEGLKRLIDLCKQRLSEDLLDQPPPPRRSVREFRVEAPVKDDIIDGQWVWIGRYVKRGVDDILNEQMRMDNAGEEAPAEEAPAKGSDRQPLRVQGSRSERLTRRKQELAIEHPKDENYLVLARPNPSGAFVIFFVDPTFINYRQVNEAFADDYPDLGTCLTLSDAGKPFEPRQHRIFVLVEHYRANNLSRSDLMNIGVSSSPKQDVDYIKVCLEEVESVSMDRVDELYTGDIELALKQYSRLALSHLRVKNQPHRDLNEFLNALQFTQYRDAEKTKMRMDYLAKLPHHLQFPSNKAEQQARKQAMERLESPPARTSGRARKSTTLTDFVCHSKAFPEEEAQQQLLASFEPAPNGILIPLFLPFCNSNRERWTHTGGCSFGDRRVKSVLGPWLLDILINGRKGNVALPYRLIDFPSVLPACRTVNIPEQW